MPPPDLIHYHIRNIKDLLNEQRLGFSIFNSFSLSAELVKLLLNRRYFIVLYLISRELLGKQCSESDSVERRMAFMAIIYQLCIYLFPAKVTSVVEISVRNPTEVNKD